VRHGALKSIAECGLMIADFWIDDLRLRVAIVDGRANYRSAISIDNPQSHSPQSAIVNLQ